MASGLFPLAAIDIPAYGHESPPPVEPEVSPGQSLTARVLDRREHMPTAMSPMHSSRPHKSASGWKLNEHPGLVFPQKKTTISWPRWSTF
jgi:hypothetical protein